MVFHNLKNKKLILGSKSPRRADLLKKMGLNFEVQTFDTDEKFPDYYSPKKIAEYLAHKKSKPFLDILKSNEIVITADTIVNNNGIVLNKPSNHLQAFEMLNSLSGKTHTVISGVVISSFSKQKVFSSVTSVTFKSLTELEINYYIKNYKPFDKAGAYGIQEWVGDIGVVEIKGSFQNVMGLPTQDLYKNLLSF